MDVGPSVCDKCLMWQVCSSLFATASKVLVGRVAVDIGSQSNLMEIGGLCSHPKGDVDFDLSAAAVNPDSPDDIWRPPDKIS